MAEKKVTTTKNIREVNNTDLDKEVKTAAKVLGEQKKVKVTIPEYLRKRLGPTVPIAVNGAVIHVPVGEKNVEIPESMAEVLNESMNSLKL